MKFPLLSVLMSMGFIHMGMPEADRESRLPVHFRLYTRFNTEVLDVIIAIETAPRYGPIRCNGDMGPGYGKLANWFRLVTSGWKLDADHVRVALVEVGPQNVTVLHHLKDPPKRFVDKIKTDLPALLYTENPQPDEIAVIDEIHNKTKVEMDGNRPDVPDLLIFVSVCNGAGITWMNQYEEEWARRPDMSIFAVKYNDDSIDPIPVYILAAGIQSDSHMAADGVSVINGRIEDIVSSCKYRQVDLSECEWKKNRCVRTEKRMSNPAATDKKFCFKSEIFVDDECDPDEECGMTTTASNPTVQSDRTSTTSAGHSSDPVTAAPIKTKATEPAARVQDEKKSSDKSGMPMWLPISR